MLTEEKKRWTWSGFFRQELRFVVRVYLPSEEDNVQEQSSRIHAESDYSHQLLLAEHKTLVASRSPRARKSLLLKHPFVTAGNTSAGWIVVLSENRFSKLTCLLGCFSIKN